MSFPSCHFPIVYDSSNTRSNTITQLSENTVFNTTTTATNVQQINPEKGLPHQDNCKIYMSIYDTLLVTSDTGTGKTGCAVYPALSAYRASSRNASYIENFTHGDLVGIEKTYIVVPNKPLAAQIRDEIVYYYTVPGEIVISKHETKSNKGTNTAKTKGVKLMNIEIITYTTLINKVRKKFNDEGIALFEDESLYRRYIDHIRANFDNTLFALDEAHHIQAADESMVTYSTGINYGGKTRKELHKTLSYTVTNVGKKQQMNYTHEEVTRVIYDILFYTKRSKLIQLSATLMQNVKVPHRILTNINYMNAILCKPPIYKVNDVNKLYNDILSTTFARTSYIAKNIPNAVIKVIGEPIANVDGAPIVTYVKMTPMETLYYIIETMITANDRIKDVVQKITGYGVDITNATNIKSRKEDEILTNTRIALESMSAGIFPTNNESTSARAARMNADAKAFITEDVKRKFVSLTNNNIIKHTIKRSGQYIYITQYLRGSVTHNIKRQIAQNTGQLYSDVKDIDITNAIIESLPWEWRPYDDYFNSIIGEIPGVGLPNIATMYYNQYYEQFSSKAKFIIDKIVEFDNDMATKYERIKTVGNTYGTKLIFVDHVDEAYSLGIYLETKGYSPMVDSDTITTHIGENIKMIDSFPKKLRYGILTSETPDGTRQNILDVNNADDNVFGEYISIVIITRAFSTGVSLNNVRVTFIMTPQLNKTYDKQTTGRSLRANTTVNIVRKLNEYGYDIVGDSIELYVYKLVQVPGELPDIFIGPDLMSIKLPNDKTSVEYVQALYILLTQYRIVHGFMYQSYGHEWRNNVYDFYEVYRDLSQQYTPDPNIVAQLTSKYQSAISDTERNKIMREYYYYTNAYTIFSIKEINEMNNFVEVLKRVTLQQVADNIETYDYYRYMSFISGTGLEGLVDAINSYTFDGYLNMAVNSRASDFVPPKAPQPTQKYNDALFMMNRQFFIDKVKQQTLDLFMQSKIYRFDDIVNILAQYNELSADMIRKIFLKYINDDGFVDRTRGIRIRLVGDVLYKSHVDQIKYDNPSNIYMTANYSFSNVHSMESFINSLTNNINQYLHPSNTITELYTLNSGVQAAIVKAIISNAWNMAGKPSQYTIRQIMYVIKNVYPKWYPMLNSVRIWIVETNDYGIKDQVKFNVNENLRYYGTLDPDEVPKLGPIVDNNNTMIMINIESITRISAYYRLHVLSFIGNIEVFYGGQWFKPQYDAYYRSRGVLRMLERLYPYEHNYDVYIIKYLYHGKYEYRIRSKLNEDETTAAIDTRAIERDRKFETYSYVDQARVMTNMGVFARYNVYNTEVINKLQGFGMQDDLVNAKVYTWFFESDGRVVNDNVRFNILLQTANINNRVFEVDFVDY